MSKLAFTPDGWTTTDVRYLRLIADHNPPRWHSYWFQLRTDAVHWRSLRLWLISGLSLSVAWFTETLALVSLAMGIIVFYFYCLFRTVPYLRDAPSVIGVIESVSPHPMPETSKAMAELPDGRSIPVAVDTVVVEELLKQHSKIELLILEDPQSQFSLAFGARPA